MKLLVYDNINIEEIQRHPNFMTLIKGQCQRSTLKFQDSCWSIAIVNPINIYFDVLLRIDLGRLGHKDHKNSNLSM